MRKFSKEEEEVLSENPGAHNCPLNGEFSAQISIPCPKLHGVNPKGRSQLKNNALHKVQKYVGYDGIPGVPRKSRVEPLESLEFRMSRNLESRRSRI